MYCLGKIIALNGDVIYTVLGGSGLSILSNLESLQLKC